MMYTRTFRLLPCRQKLVTLQLTRSVSCFSTRKCPGGIYSRSPPTDRYISVSAAFREGEKASSSSPTQDEMQTSKEEQFRNMCKGTDVNASDGTNTPCLVNVSSSSENKSDSQSTQDDMGNPFLRHDPEVIPELPAITKDPARHVDSWEVEFYIKPLYTRFWGISASEAEYDRGGKKVSRMLPELSKGFSLVGDAAALRFMLEVADISRVEEHYPRVTVHGNVVLVNSRTSKSWPHHVVPDTEHIRPGITWRDIRLAILVERKFAESYEADGLGTSVYIGQTQPLEPARIRDTVMAAVRTYQLGKTKKPQNRFRTRICTICRRAGHHMVNCPWRFTKQATKPCPVCGGMHWKVNCPALHPPPELLPVP